MSCNNCHTFHGMCKAACCSVAPLPRSTYFGNFDKQQRPVKEILDLDAEMILPVTEDGSCPFLQSDYKCAIYNQRPEICRKFGDESHPMMTCAYQTKDGQARSKKTVKTLLKQQHSTVNEILYKIKHK
jgi:Fe-S-cluster containining protein